MIFITRTASPKTLKDKTSEGDHYNKQAVVEALWEMQYGKCCYCERRLPRKGHLKAVEHFAPKAIFNGLRNEWSNLLLACSQCNGKKSDKFPVILSDEVNEDKVVYLSEAQEGVTAIIDPTVIDPEKHLDYDFSEPEWRDRYGGLMAKNGSILGAETIATIGLAGPFYEQLKYSHLLKVLQVYYTNLLEAKLEAKRTGNDLMLAGQRAAFENLMAPQTEFAGFARAFARHKRLDETPINLTIPGDA